MNDIAIIEKFQLPFTPHFTKSGTAAFQLLIDVLYSRYGRNIEVLYSTDSHNSIRNTVAIGKEIDPHELDTNFYPPITEYRDAVVICLLSCQDRTGEILPQRNIDFIVNYYKSILKCPVFICLDTCHELFVLQRNYAAIDFLLFSSHVTVDLSNTGMLLINNTLDWQITTTITNQNKLSLYSLIQLYNHYQSYKERCVQQKAKLMERIAPLGIVREIHYHENYEQSPFTFAFTLDNVQWMPWEAHYINNIIESNYWPTGEDAKNCITDYIRIKTIHLTDDKIEEIYQFIKHSIAMRKNAVLTNNLVDVLPEKEKQFLQECYSKNIASLISKNEYDSSRRVCQLQ